MTLTKHTGAKIAAAAVALLAGAQIAQATPVNYFGATFNLSINDIGMPGGIYEVKYTADFSAFTNSLAQPFIDSIAWKHAGADVSWVTLTSDPGTGWISFEDSTVNAGGCSTSGGMTWACAQDFSTPFVPTSGLLTWVFQATFSGGSLASTDTTGDSIKARFVNASGAKQGALLSCTLNDSTDDNCTVDREVPPPPVQVPEPATLAMFGLGLLGFGFRRKQAK
jgi:hypothetical protein